MSSEVSVKKHRSEKQKLEAVQTWMIFGNLAQAGRVLNIPHETLRAWKKQDWWKEMEQDLKLQDDMQLSARLKKIVTRSLDVVEDRLEQGDFFYDQKSGELRRKPVAMKDAHKVAEDSIKRVEILATKQISLPVQEATADKLMKLAQKFAELAGSAHKEEPIELEVVEINGVSGEVWGVSDAETTETVGSEEQSGTA